MILLMLMQATFNPKCQCILLYTFLKNVSNRNLETLAVALGLPCRQQTGFIGTLSDQ